MKLSELGKTVDRFITQIKKEYDIIGIMLCGSYARGQWKPGSDIDISFLVRSGSSVAVGQFRREFEGIAFDYGIDTPESLMDILLNDRDLGYKKMVAHSLSAGSKVICDPFGEVGKVKEFAEKVRDQFEVGYGREEK